MERVEGAVSTGIDANCFGGVRGAIHRPEAWNGTGGSPTQGAQGGSPTHAGAVFLTPHRP